MNYMQTAFKKSAKMGNANNMLTTQLGAGLGGLIDTGLGLVMEHHNDARQLYQQKQLTNIQLNANKQLSDYNAAQQLKMWHNTSYAAQLAEMKKAGLSPGLMYGGGGGGGTTTGGGAQSVSGGTAAPQSGEILGIMQLQNMKAQNEVLKSQANLNNAQAEKTSGVDTQVATNTIEQLKAQTTNTVAQTALTNIETTIKTIESNYADGKAQHTVEILDQQVGKLIEEINTLKQDREITADKRDAIVQTAQQEAINSVIRGSLMKADIELKNQNIITQITQLAQNAQKIGIEKTANEFGNILKTAGAKLMDKERELATWKVITQGVGTVVNGLTNFNAIKNIGQ